MQRHRKRPRRDQCTDRGKHPVVAFTEKATTKTPVIHAWWAGSTYNVGINVGKSGLLVIDEDQPDAFAKYAADHGVQIPTRSRSRPAKAGTTTSKTPRMARSGTPKACSANTASMSAAATPTWWVLALSTHPEPPTQSNRTMPSRPCRVGLSTLSEAKTNGHKADSDGWTWFGGDYDDPFELPEVISDGQRDSVLFKFACSLNAQGIRRRTAELLMREAFQRCEQPPTAGTAFTWDEALAKLEQAYRYESGRAEARGEQPAVARRAKITRASDIIIRPVVWAWAIDGFGRIPCRRR